jgi:hypothetical protein
MILLQNATESDSCRRSKTTTTIEAYATHNDRDVKEPVFGSFSARNSRNGSTKSLQTPLHVTEFVSSILIQVLPWKAVDQLIPKQAGCGKTVLM